MSWNVLTNPDAVNSAYGVQDAIRPVIDAHPAWEFVETVLGTGTRRADVYRCLGTANGFGNDFYVISVASATGTANFSFSMGEAYDGTNKRLVRPAPFHGSTAVTPAADGSYGTDRHVANESQGATAGYSAAFAGVSTSAAPIPSGSSPILLSVSPQRIVYSIGTTHYAYIGLYERNYSAAIDPVPLFGGGLQTVANNSWEGSHSTISPSNRGAVTRDLIGPQSTTYAFSAAVDSPQVAPMIQQTTTISKDVISNQWYTSRLRIQQVNRRPNLRGWLYDTVGIAMGDVSHGTSDTVTVDGADYAAVYVASGKYSIWVPVAA